jgi:carnitine O-acetyltransferase
MMEMTWRLPTRADAGAQVSRTFDNLGQLPRLPVPNFADTIRRFEEWCTPLLSAEEWQKTRDALITFSRPGGPGERLHNAILDYDKQPGVYSWLDEFWPKRYLGRRTPLPVNANFFFLFRNQPGDQIARAAELTAAAIDYKLRLDNEEIPPANLRDRALCMVQNKYLFSSTRLPGELRDSARSPYSTARPGPSAARHVLVIHNGHLYRFDAVAPNGRAHTCSAIADSLREIVNATPITNDHALGFLSTLPRPAWARERAHLAALSDGNNNSMLAIDDALFCLCLDGAEPNDTLAASTQLLHGDGANRWFDKSVSLVVFANGMAGVNIEHCGLDGTTVVEFIDHLFARETIQRITNDSDKVNDQPARESLAFDLDERIRDTIALASTEFHSMAAQIATLAFTFGDFGAVRIKQLKASPDAFAQIAFQLAHFRTKGLIGTTYESIATRTFDRGRTEAMRVVTPQILHFVEKMQHEHASHGERIEAFRTAAKAHSQRARDCQSGQAPEQHLWQMQMIASQRGRDLGIEEPLDLFGSPGWRKMRNDYLSTSSAPSNHCLTFGFGATSEQCIGIGYIVWSDHISAFLSTPRTGESAMHEFAQHLEVALRDIAKLLDSGVVT